MAIQGKTGVNPFGLTRILTKKWRKSADKKHGSDYYRHPNFIGKKGDRKMGESYLDLAEITYLTPENAEFSLTKNGFPASYV